jgi:integrase
LPRNAPTSLTHGSHIAKKRGTFYYRRRLPGGRGDVALSLGTRSFREAEHRAAILDRAFGEAWQRAQGMVTEDIGAILRGYLREALEVDLEARLVGRPGVPLFGGRPDYQQTATEQDLDTLSYVRSLAEDALADRDFASVRVVVDNLMRAHGLPEEVRNRLSLGVLEANVAILDAIRRRTTGEDPAVFEPHSPAPSSGDPPDTPSPPPTGPAPTESPLASEVLPLFIAWGRASGGWKAGAARQALVSMELFIEARGDQPIASYTRADGDEFRTILRRLPATYRKSVEDRDRSLSEIIARADASGAKRISEKTVKRHVWALSRFFAFLMETGRLPRGADNPGRGLTFNLGGSARRQRDMWTGDELWRLFASPVWTGCHPFFRSQPGPEIIRDALFWLPLLGLFHGNRLEEFAQLYREDVGQDEGVWFLHIRDEGDRQIKNMQSERRVPLHPELIRVGLLDYVASAAPRPTDRVFPDLKPGGPDKKLGYGFSKRFTHYRKAIGLHRSGLDYHSFRHGVTTRLYEADVSEGWIDLLTGHESGGESRRRYLKSVRLPLLKEAIQRVAWPEVDLSGLYIRAPGDERWPVRAAPEAA